MGRGTRRPPNRNRPATARSAGELLNRSDEMEEDQRDAFSDHVRERAKGRYEGESDAAVKEARKDLGGE